MTIQRKTQIGITATSFCFVCVHLLWPDRRIDAITLILLLAAAIPWLLPLFRSIEFPGGLKLEFQDLQAAEQRAAEVGLLDEAADDARSEEYSFLAVTNKDANLALAGLRIEIEKRLGVLARGAGIRETRMGIGKLLQVLPAQGILSYQQCGVLKDMVELLNSAVHGANVDQQSAEWALRIGPKLLSTLDKHIEG